MISRFSWSIPVAAVFAMAALTECSAQSSAQTKQSTSTTAPKHQAVTSNKADCENRVYKLKLMNDGVYGMNGPKEDQGRWGGKVYTASDDETISVIRIDFQTEKAAAKAFKQEITSAEEVMERGPVKGHEKPAIW